MPQFGDEKNMKNRIQYNFNEGKLFYGRIGTKRNDLGKKVGQEFSSSGHLFFDYKSIRQSDIENYQTTDKKLDLKVHTYYIPGVNDSHKVEIDNDLYNVVKIDPSNDRKTMYWYLSKLGGKSSEKSET